VRGWTYICFIPSPLSVLLISTRLASGSLSPGRRPCPWRHRRRSRLAAALLSWIPISSSIFDQSGRARPPANRPASSCFRQTGINRLPRIRDGRKPAPLHRHRTRLPRAWPGSGRCNTISGSRSRFCLLGADFRHARDEDAHLRDGPSPASAPRRNQACPRPSRLRDRRDLMALPVYWMIAPGIAAEDRRTFLVAVRTRPRPAGGGSASWCRRRTRPRPCQHPSLKGRVSILSSKKSPPKESRIGDQEATDRGCRPTPAEDHRILDLAGGHTFPCPLAMTSSQVCGPSWP